MKTVHRNNANKIPFDEDYAGELYQRAIRRIENMSYQEAESELPDWLFDLYKSTFPDRCPQTCEKTVFVKEDKFTVKEKLKTGLRNPVQPRLF